MSFGDAEAAGVDMNAARIAGLPTRGSVGEYSPLPFGAATGLAVDLGAHHEPHAVGAVEVAGVLDR